MIFNSLICFSISIFNCSKSISVTVSTIWWTYDIFNDNKRKSKDINRTFRMDFSIPSRLKRRRTVFWRFYVPKFQFNPIFIKIIVLTLSFNASWKERRDCIEINRLLYSLDNVFDRERIPKILQQLISFVYHRNLD